MPSLNRCDNQGDPSFQRFFAGVALAGIFIEVGYLVYMYYKTTPRLIVIDFTTIGFFDSYKRRQLTDGCTWLHWGYADEESPLNWTDLHQRTTFGWVKSIT